MIKELCMPEHSKDLMNLDKLTLPKLIWLIKIPWQEIPQIYLYFSLTDSLYIYPPSYLTQLKTPFIHNMIKDVHYNKTDY